MELPFVDSSETPLPPSDVRLRSIEVHPYPDRRRLKVSLDLTPFQVAPDIEITLKDERGGRLASANIIGAVSNKMTLTLHIRTELPSQDCTVEASLGYDEIGIVHTDSVVFSVLGSSIVEED